MSDQEKLLSNAHKLSWLATVSCCFDIALKTKALCATMLPGEDRDDQSYLADRLTRKALAMAAAMKEEWEENDRRVEKALEKREASK